MTYLLSPRFSMIADSLTILLIVSFGVGCIIRPKFANLSRSMGIIFLGVGLAYAATRTGWWRMDALSCAVLVAPGLLWCALECFRLQRRRVLSGTVGASLVILG